MNDGMSEMRKRKCHSSNGRGGKQDCKKGNGVLGHVNNTARTLTALSTFGMSNLVWKKSKGNEKTKTIIEKTCLCQSCGNSWVIE